MVKDSHILKQYFEKVVLMFYSDVSQKNNNLKSLKNVKSLTMNNSQHIENQGR